MPNVEAAMKVARIVITGLAVGVLAAIMGTGHASAFERVGDKKLLVFAGRHEVSAIDRSFQYASSIRMMQHALYDALVRYVGSPPEVQPWLPAKWEACADAKTWTFHLVKNAKFHSGDPVTAEAVRWSFARRL